MDRLAKASRAIVENLSGLSDVLAGLQFELQGIVESFYLSTADELNLVLKEVVAHVCTRGITSHAITEEQFSGLEDLLTSGLIVATGFKDNA